MGIIADTMRLESNGRSPARLLGRLFGTMPQAAGDRATRADLNQPDLWIDQFLDP